jgi:hypothetical protein
MTFSRSARDEDCGRRWLGRAERPVVWLAGAAFSAMVWTLLIAALARWL